MQLLVDGASSKQVFSRAHWPLPLLVALSPPRRCSDVAAVVLVLLVDILIVLFARILLVLLVIRLSALLGGNTGIHRVMQRGKQHVWRRTRPAAANKPLQQTPVLGHVVRICGIMQHIVHAVRCSRCSLFQLLLHL